MNPDIPPKTPRSSGPSINFRRLPKQIKRWVIPMMLVLILPVIIFEVLHNQDTRQHASGTTQSFTIPLPIHVLVLEYFPLDPNNSTNLDGVETGWGSDATINGRTVQFWEQATTDMITTAIPVLNESSKYHGYKDPSATAFLNYQVVDTKKYFTPIPRGVYLGTQTDGTIRYRPYYAQILSNVNICTYVDNLGVQEVWMYGYHSKQIEPDESRMSSKYGDISNSYPKEEAIPTQYKMPRCSKAYTLYNFTYQPGGGTAIANTVHNRIHQIENMIPFTEGKYPPIPPSQPNSNIPGSTFWGDFSEYVNNTTNRSSYRSSCGNAHYPPNWQNASTDSYLYNLKTQASFNCETWNPDDTKTTYITAGCERWGCTDLGFYKYFMQNIPGFNNGIVYQGKSMKNWWEAFYDFEAFIDNGHSLYGTSIIASPSPTSQPTITPPPVTATPTSKPTTTPTPTPLIPTPTYPAVSTLLSFTVYLHGIGNGGDNANPSSKGTAAPGRTIRTGTVSFYDTKNVKVLEKIVTLTYQPLAGNFTGSLELGTSLKTGMYVLKMKAPAYLAKQIPGIYTITQGQPATIQAVSLTNGDVNNDNVISIKDYDILIGCYSDFLPAVSCTSDAKGMSDLDDDGAVNQNDYNLLMREWSHAVGD